MSASRIPKPIRRIFSETFTAKDIAESLASFDATTPTDIVREFMRANDFDVVGIREAGHVVGFVEREKLVDGPCGNACSPLDITTLPDDDLPLLDVLRALNQTPFLFINVFGRVAGIVTPADLQKAPVRMWLFGLVTLIELRCTELVERHCPNEFWTKFLSVGRLQKSRSLLAMRSQRNQSLKLLDCLQFADKGQIVARHAEIRDQTVFASRRQAEDAMKKLEQLRNSLAHSQDIIACDWETILLLCDFIRGQFNEIQVNETQVTPQDLHPVSNS